MTTDQLRATPAALSQGALPADLGSALLQDVVQHQIRWRAPGVSVGIVRDGELAWSAHVGSARLEPMTTADLDTPFLIGSITKTFTAVLTMALRDQGLLHLNDTLATHLGGAVTGNAALADVTVHQLLTHTGGLQREYPGDIWHSIESPNAAEFRAGLSRVERVVTPGRQHHYSNLGYALLGQVIESVTGQSWEQALRGAVLDPLGMKSTGLQADPSRCAAGYFIHPHTGVASPEPVMRLGAISPIGGLWSTLADLTRYAAFLTDPAGTGADVLSPETVAEMYTPVVMTDENWCSGQGIGFSMARKGERVLLGHSGSLPGFMAGLRFRPQERIAAIVLTNTGTEAEPLKLATSLLCTVLDRTPPVSQVWQPCPPRPELAGLLGRWWMDGTEMDFEIRGDELWGGHVKFLPAGPDCWRGADGSAEGERLVVRRNDSGQIISMRFSTYDLTREPRSFADGLR